MKPLEYTGWLSAVERFSGIPLWVADASGHVFAPSIGGGFNTADFSLVCYAPLFSDRPVLATGDALEQYISFPLPKENGRESFLIGGPVCAAAPSAWQRACGLPCFHGISSERGMGALGRLPVVAPNQFCEFSAFLCGAVLHLEQTAQVFADGLISLSVSEQEHSGWQDTLFSRREEASPHLPYENELSLLNCVKSGDLAQLKRLFSDFDISRAGRLSSDPFRQSLYLMIASTTLITRFAVEGGLDMEEAYTLSDFYIQRADACREASAIKELHTRMLLDFTSRVEKTRRLVRYSPPVTAAIDYIFCHLHYTIRLDELAEHCALTPHYLSARFRKETNKTITRFILDERIREAKNLLRHSRMTCQEIGSTLAFGTQSYFISVFRRETGWTPGGYRVRYHGVDRE